MSNNLSIGADKHAQLTTERVTKTSIYKFDQITAVSQASINRQLEHMHGLYEILRKLDIRQEDDEDMGLIDCVLEPPQVVLHTGVNKQRVTYYIRIKVSSNFDFNDDVAPYSLSLVAERVVQVLHWNGSQGEVSQHPAIHSMVTYHSSFREAEIRIENWLVALNVNMALDQMDKRLVPKNVQKQIKNLDDYSVYQLLLDFTGQSPRTPEPPLHQALTVTSIRCAYGGLHRQRINHQDP